MESRLLILYPSNPLRSGSPDENYAVEYDAVVQSGFETLLHSFEEFQSGRFRSRPGIQPGQTVLYRGWMLSLSDYSRLEEQVRSLGATLFTSSAQYERCHHLPGWYAQLAELTPETRFFRETDDVAAQLRAAAWTGCFLKDYVKSLTGSETSLVHDLSRIPEIVAKMRMYRGKIEGGLCARRLEDFDETTEDRYFVIHRTPFSRDGRIPEVVNVATQRIDSPFFSIDVVQRHDGLTRIVELGDGQVSDLKKWTIQQFLRVLQMVRTP